MRRRLIAIAVILAAGLFTIAPAGAQPTQSGVVSQDPVDWTPHVLDGTVYAIAVVGQTVVVGGEFTEVREVGGPTFDRTNLFAFALGSGKVLDFAPRVDGTIRALAAGPGNTVYIGGNFNKVNAERHRGLAQVHLDGRLEPRFATALHGYGYARTMATRGNHLYVGGEFTGLGGVEQPALARLDTATGAVDPTFDLRLSRYDDGRLWVQSLALNADGTLLAFDGTFTEVADEFRYQVAVARTDGPKARLSSWSTMAYADSYCDPRYQTYLRGLDMAADGSYFVVTSSGHEAGSDRMCNSAARFNTNSGPDAEPAWINHTGGNTLLSVAVTGPAVYVGGHQRWLDNPYGDKYPGPGAVSRPGIGAIDPESGLALSWNPTKDRGVGTEALVAYPGGLLVGSDTERLGREYHPRLGAFPLP